ncbi:hypothetical protein PINS_up013162 [Pythium insidiosum]|nr:hypothetical protein PINS_up013162 [Pythium insidiosum]
MLHNEASELQGSLDLVRVFEVDVDDASCPGFSAELLGLDRLRDFLVLSSRTTADDSLLQSSLMTCLEDVVIHSAMRNCGVRDEHMESIRAELVSELFRQSLVEARANDTLERHIRYISPANETRCERLPDAVRVRLDVHVVRVNTQHVLKVWNASLRCQVLGQIEFRRGEHVIIFTPSIPFERHTRYQVTLRAQDVETTLGPFDAAKVTFEFFTS